MRHTVCSTGLRAAVWAGMLSLGVVRDGAAVLPAPGSLAQARIPFVANAGQWPDPALRFGARTFGGTVYVAADGALVYVLPESTRLTDPGAGARAVTLREVFLDTDRAAEPGGVNPASARVSQFTGRDPARWRADLAAWQAVSLGELYDGIRLEVRAGGDNVEKVFTLSPGADPGRIAMRLEGASAVAVESGGELAADTVLGTVRFTAPVAWQAGPGGRREPVDVAYAVRGGRIGFQVGAYDRARPLVIDPLLASTFIGGTLKNVVRALAVDAGRRVVAAGYTASLDFPATNAPGLMTYGGGLSDGFVALFDPTLTNLLAAAYLGGAGEDVITSIGLNGASGAVLLGGYTASPDFPTLHAHQSSFQGGAYDGFLTALGSNLNVLTASTYLGGAADDRVHGLALSAAGEIFVAGATASSNFPVSGSPYQSVFKGNADAFVAKFGPSAQAPLQAATFVGGAAFDRAYSVAVDGAGYVYAAGATDSTNFPTTPNAFQRNRAFILDGFVAKLDSALATLSAGTYLGGSGNDAIQAIGVAPYTNLVCVAGYTESANFVRNPTNNIIAPGFTNQHGGGRDAFLTQLGVELTNMVRSSYLGGPGTEEATAILVHAETNAESLRILVAGKTDSARFPVTTNACQTALRGGTDAFLSLWQTGAALAASTYLGGDAADAAYALAFRPDRQSVLVGGATLSSNFPTTFQAHRAERGARTDEDGFVSRLAAGLSLGSVKWRARMQDQGDTDFGIFGAPTLGWDGTVYAGGGSNLYAFYPDGSLKWKFQASGRLATAADVFYGLASVPAVDRHGTVYVGTENGYLHAVNPDGSSKWSILAPGAEQSGFYASPVLSDDGTVYIGNYSRSFYAYSSNGVCLWTNTSSASPILHGAAVDRNGRIFFTKRTSPILYMLQPSGMQQRSWTLPGNTANAAPAIGTNGWVYVSSDTNLYAYDPAAGATTPVRTWTAARTISSAPAFASNGVLYVAGGSNVYAFNPDGTTQRIWVLGGEPVASSPAVTEDGSILIGSSDTNLVGSVYSLNPNGTTNWVTRSEDFITYQSPLVCRDGTIYMTDRKYVYALCGPAQVSQASWPMFKHDPLRTGNVNTDPRVWLKPAGLTASKGAYYDRVEVQWTAVPNTDYYELVRCLSNDLAAAVPVGGWLLEPAYTDTNVMPGLVYFYWVRAATPVALSEFSEPDEGGIPPLAPEQLTASKGTPTNAVVVAWRASSNATDYILYRSRTNDTATAVQIWSQPGTNYTDATVERGLTYYYWVKAGAAIVGYSPYSAGDGQANRGGTPPSPPASLTATDNSHLAVYLNWSASTGATMYALYRDTNTVAPAQFLAVTAGQSWPDITTEAQLTYYYWVRATNEYGLGEYSAMVSGLRLLVPPFSIKASKGEFTNKVVVSWTDDLPLGKTYLIYRNSSSNPPAAPIGEVFYTGPTSTNYDDVNITRGVGYYYWVRAKNAYGTSDFSHVDLGGTPPRAPAALTATEGTDVSQVLLSWTAADYAAAYEVYRQTSYDPAGFVTPVGLVNAPAAVFYDVGARPGQRYYYRLRSTSQFGRSELSGFVIGWRELLAPEALVASKGASERHVAVTWRPVDNAAAYEVWRGPTDSLASASKLHNGVPTNLFYDAEAAPGSVYYYWARAKTAQFFSQYSRADYGYRALGQVDLSVSDLVFLPTVMAFGKSPGAVSFRLRNNGSRDMLPPNTAVACNFYVSTNPVFNLLQVQTVGEIRVQVGLSVNQSMTVSLPQALRENLAMPEVAPGSYYVFVQVDHVDPSQWVDPNHANNIARRGGAPIRVAETQVPIWVVNDYDGDGRTDLAMYSEPAGAWQVWLMASGARAAASGLGGSGWLAVPADYDGDGKADPAVYQEALGAWTAWLSAFDYRPGGGAGWGGPGFGPVPADYDGDGRTDPAVYQEASGAWKVWPSGARYTQASVNGWGGVGSLAVPADYDGDGKADPAVYERADGTWRLWYSTLDYQQPVIRRGMGGPGWAPVPADYDRDGRADPAVYAEALGFWKGWISGNGYALAQAGGLGGPDMKAVPGDYDGDGLIDPAIYWDAFGLWRLALSSLGYQYVDLLAWPGAGYQPAWRGRE